MTTGEILLDLDNTLIRSIDRAEQEKIIAAQYGISAKNFQHAIDMTFEKYGWSNFGHEGLIASCKLIKPDLNCTELYAKWQKILNTPHFFPDALEFLRAFPKRHMILLTTGSADFQRNKIATHSLAKYFSRIIIVNSPKAHHIATPTANSLYIDDSPREIDAMKILFPHVYCIQIREAAPWEKQKRSVLADAHCATLTEAADLIKRFIL